MVDLSWDYIKVADKTGMEQFEPDLALFGMSELLK